MTPDETTDYIEATAATLGLTIEPEWKENVARFFEVAKGMAALVTESGALESSEAAAVFTPRDVE
jgi:hypothetical protein